MFNKNVLLYGGALALLAFAIGCSNEPVREANRSSASGLVTLDGKPLAGGSVTLTLAKDPMYRVIAMIRSDGHFSVDNAPTGEVLVAIETESAQSGNPKGYIPIPAKYANVKTSGLTATIDNAETAGAKLSFDLKSK
jgi:hypothetical protein